MKLNDAFFGAFLAALGGFVLWKVQGFPAIPGQQYGAGAFPGLIAAGLLVVAYILWADALGFLLLAPLVLAAWLWALGLRPLPAAALAIVASLVIWFAFYKLLRVPLPWGVLKSFAF